MLTAAEVMNPDRQLNPHRVLGPHLAGDNATQPLSAAGEN